MSDRELLDALSVLARRFGLLERGQRLAIVGDPRDEQPIPASRCGFSVSDLPGALACGLHAGHEGDHVTSWGEAFKARTMLRPFDPDYRCEVATEATGGTWSCRRERGHDGPCAAEPLCHAIDGCIHRAGHLGDHETPKLCGAKNAAENLVMAGQVCSLPRGHEGSHEATVNGQRWLFGVGTRVCGAVDPSPGYGGVCDLPAGHDDVCSWNWTRQAANPTVPRT